MTGRGIMDIMFNMEEQKADKKAMQMKWAI